MNQATERIETLKEIHVDKMHFCVISKHPQYSADTKPRIHQNMRRELYSIFKKYT